MLRKVLWIAAACAAVLVALAVSRSLYFDNPRPAPAEAPAAPEVVVAPVAEAAPEAAPPPPPVAAKPPPPPPEEQQVQDDAAATGMTTMEPQAESREPAAEEPPF